MARFRTKLTEPQRQGINATRVLKTLGKPPPPPRPVRNLSAEELDQGGSAAAAAATDGGEQDTPTPWLELGAELAGLGLGEAREARLSAQTRDATVAARLLLARGLLKLDSLTKLVPRPLAGGVPAGGRARGARESPRTSAPGTCSLSVCARVCLPRRGSRSRCLHRSLSHPRDMSPVLPQCLFCVFHRWICGGNARALRPRPCVAFTCISQGRASPSPSAETERCRVV